MSLTPEQQMSFGVLALFKNEAGNIAEWINHYLSQGASKIVLVNNGSDDDWSGQIGESNGADMVEVLHDNRKHAQVDIYRDALASNRFPNETWLLVCDLDEFAYARFGYGNIHDYLSRASLKGVGAIMLPWKSFGSSGFNRQPRGVRESFLYRATAPFPEPHPGFSRGKYLCRIGYTHDLCVHHPILRKGKYILSTGRDISRHSDLIRLGYVPNSEKQQALSVLHLNHYPVQSRDYFFNIKAKRGDAYFKTPRLQTKDNSYFDKFNKNDVFDDELSRLTGKQTSRHNLESSQYEAFKALSKKDHFIKKQLRLAKRRAVIDTAQSIGFTLSLSDFISRARHCGETTLE
jgi:hypothetical protein